MKHEDQVSNLEYSQRLKELGVKQESLFYWSFIQDGRWILEKGKGWGDTYSAFTVAELGEGLRKAYKHMGGKIRTFSTSERMRQVVSDIDSFKDEANARSKMLIYLIENKLISV